MKLRKLHIEDYKMFKDFDISFVDENDEALPIIILAGVNGSGKSSLLEFIPKANHHESNIDRQLNYDDYRDSDFIEVSRGVNQIINKLSPNPNSNLPSEFGLLFEEVELDEDKDIILFPAGIDDTKEVADEFVKTFYHFLKNHDYRPSEVKDHFDDYMKDIFNGLELTFKYSHLDRDDNVWFKNENGESFKIDELSTGEKTLLSKVLYLYFLDYKDKIILIDEPELSLHPKWQNQILSVYEKLAKKNNCQIIIATHSPHIIGSAKNKYLRILRKNEEGNIEAISDLMAYGRDIEWVLEEVMGTQYTRERSILKKIEACQVLIDEEKYDEAEKAIDNLEAIIGVNDSEVLTLRNDLAFERMDFEEDN